MNRKASRKTGRAVLALILALLTALPAFAAPSDPLFGEQWELEALGYEQSSLTGKGVTVAVIDSGFYRDHEDLRNVAVSPLSKNFLGTDETAYGRDQIGHGTFVASLIAAETDNGTGIASIAPGAELMILRCFSASGNLTFPYDESKDEGSGTVSLIASAVRYAADNGADVINMSLGSLVENEEFESAVAYAIEKGVILVAAIGNMTSQSNAPYYPAAFSGVTGVGSVALQDENITRSAFSIVSPNVDVAAPGTAVHGVWIYPGYALGTKKQTLFTEENVGETYLASNGTSFAAPLISALAALAKEADPKITSAEFEALLERTSQDLGEEGKDSSFGVGLPDMNRFLAELIPEEEPEPPAEETVPAENAEPVSGNDEKEITPLLTVPPLAKSKTYEGVYTDCSEAEWFFDDAVWAYEFGLMEGDGSLFNPGGYTTRGQLVTILYRLSGEPGTANPNPFTDVEAGKYYETPVAWANGNKIVEGRNESTFDPDSPISRQDVAVILKRFADACGAKPVETATLEVFSDAEKVSDYAVDALEWATAAGLLQGDAGRLDPLSPAPRKQIATILHRFTALLPE